MCVCIGTCMYMYVGMCEYKRVYVGVCRVYVFVGTYFLFISYWRLGRCCVVFLGLFRFVGRWVVVFVL